MTDDLLVALIIGSSLLIPAGLIAWWLLLRFRRRELQHQAWMAALEKGAPLQALSPVETNMGGPRSYLLQGLIWLICGVTLTLFLSGVWLTSGRQPSLETQLRQVQELRRLGYSEDDVRWFSSQVRMRYPLKGGVGGRPEFPLGLAFVGIVPAWIGIAYLIFYRLETRRIREGK